jgi:hypothetical protein
MLRPSFQRFHFFRISDWTLGGEGERGRGREKRVWRKGERERERE